MSSLEGLIQTIQTYKPDADIDLLRRAYDFSAVAHAGQTRRSGEQYITHPLEVAGVISRE